MSEVGTVPAACGSIGPWTAELCGRGIDLAWSAEQCKMERVCVKGFAGNSSLNDDKIGIGDTGDANGTEHVAD